jgi:hypothetical protein
MRATQDLITARKFLIHNLRFDTSDQNDTVIYIGNFMLGGAHPYTALESANRSVEELAPLLVKFAGDLLVDNVRLVDWVKHLQKGTTVNCVYCGHTYGPDPGTPVSMADILKEHIQQCPKHPLAEAHQEIERLKQLIPRPA